VALLVPGFHDTKPKIVSAENLLSSGSISRQNSAIAEAEDIMLRLEEAIAIGNHREAARLAKEVSKVSASIYTQHNSHCSIRRSTVLGLPLQ
jgi:hypothetical protein